MLMRWIALFYAVNNHLAKVSGLLLLLGTRAAAQEERWDTYMARYGDKPGSVLVNMALMATAPDKKYPYLVITGPHAHNCNKQGIPTNDEIAGLENMLDASTDFITGVTAKVLAGTFTYKCDRLNYYYVKDTAGVRDALARMYKRSFGDYNYTIKIKQDPEWISYRTFLYPDSAAARWMSYSKTIASMAEQGDSLTQPRDIHYEAWFRSDTDRKAFATFAQSKGYRADSITSEGAIARFGVIVSRKGMVKMDAITAAEDELMEQIKKHRGYYNGWKAPLDADLKRK